MLIEFVWNFLGFLFGLPSYYLDFLSTKGSFDRVACFKAIKGAIIKWMVVWYYNK